ncbi:hypothetical protein GCM10010124_07150 [Pilimelia terevasa]|uniref:Uncharacterized protein n=1 Tax=Pilimelia terevasa TaxID=53372 RepID=A0A8J3FET3_9ACTN|nr:diguanylate cyclase [Pilimelia terevasa]GGK17165.1 hypothetical protein GCM10010124_07150 [Pilimelia terevasa]
MGRQHPDTAPAGAPRPSDGPRWPRWATAGLVLATLALAPLFATHAGGARGQLLLFWGAIAVLDLAAALAAYLVAGRMTDPHVRRFWRMLSGASQLFLVGDVGFGLGETGYLPGLAAQLSLTRELALLMGGGALLWTMLIYPVGRGTGRAGFAFWLDAATVLVGASVVRWYLGVPEGATNGQLAHTTATAGVLLVAVFAGGRIIASDRPAAARTPAYLLVAGAAGEVFFDVVLPLPDASTASGYGLLHLARLLPALLLALAGVVQLGAVRQGTPGVRPAPAVRYPVLPIVMIAVVTSVLVISLPPLPLRSVGVLAGGIAVAALISTRYVLSTRDAVRLQREAERRLAELERHQQLQHALLQYSSDITSIIGRDLRFTFASPAVTRILGFPLDEIVGRPAHTFMHPEDRIQLRPLMRHLRRTPGHTARYQARYRHADGSWRWLEVTATNRMDDPTVAGLVSNSREITQARELQHRLRHEAAHDPVTRLANRAAFLERVTLALAGDGAPPAATVVLVNLDDFRGINDAHGLAAGDEALAAFADVLRGCVRHRDLAARLGGDEFALLLPDTTAGEATLVARRLLDALARPVVVAGQPVHLRASIGIAAAAGREAADLMRAGAEALSAARRQGRHCFAVHDPWSPRSQPVTS